MFDRKKDDKKKKGLNVTPILFAVFLIAICGIIYELIIGAISSYLMGNSVKQYSITIGLFMSAMGVGSILSKKIDKDLFDKFVIIELSLGILGGFSAFLLLYSYAYTEFYKLAMYFCILGIGMLVGLEIPILTRMIEDSESDLKSTIANVLSFDYIGALIGSLAFPLILLPSLGQLKTSFLVGIINVIVAVILIIFYKSEIKNYRVLKFISLSVLVLLIGFFATGDSISRGIENNLYRDRVIYSSQSKYQKIVTTKHKDDLRLFLDGNIQFSSKDEYRYHESLIHPALSLAKKRDRVLVLGGGDGLALREILKYKDVKEIVLVDIDSEMLEYCKTDPLISKLNEGALENNRVKIIAGDGYKYLEENKDPYDVIIIDFPDPNNESLNKLYTNIFYRLVWNNLTDEGIATVQSTSPLEARRAFWCINRTIKSENFYVEPYTVHVPSFGGWGFNMFSKKKFNHDNIDIKVSTKFLSNENFEGLFTFGKDESDSNEIRINTLTDPILIGYYEEAVNGM